MKSPSLYTLDNLLTTTTDGTTANVNGQWVPARPLGYPSWRERVRIAWLVFTGRADAVTWAGQ